jgi:hypothetical protein
MMKVLSQHDQDQISFLAVAESGDLDAIESGADRLGLGDHVLMSSVTADEAFEVTQYPVTFLLSNDGRLLARLDRGQSPDSFDSQIKTALAQLQ